jgi:hypothetical protein
MKSAPHAARSRSGPGARSPAGRDEEAGMAERVSGSLRLDDGTRSLDEHPDGRYAF